MKRFSIAAAMIVFAGSVFAAEQTVQPKQGGTNAQGSCVGVFSSQVTHNGVAVREQARSGERSENVQAARDANCQRATKAD